MGCRTHVLNPLVLVLRDHLKSFPGLGPFPWMVDPIGWGHPWFPILALKELESASMIGKKKAKLVKSSRQDREWAISSYLWLVWTNKMKEVHGDGYAPPHKLTQSLTDAMLLPADLRPLC